MGVYDENNSNFLKMSVWMISSIIIKILKKELKLNQAFI